MERSEVKLKSFLDKVENTSKRYHFGVHYWTYWVKRFLFYLCYFGHEKGKK